MLGQALENEVAHFQTRLHRIEDGHRLELARLKKEVEYHKRLRQVNGWKGYLIIRMHHLATACFAVELRAL